MGECLLQQCYSVMTKRRCEFIRTQRRFEAIDAPLAISAGEAGDLIATYGLGTHEGAVVVRLDDGGRSTTASHTFVLEAPAP